MNIKKLGKLALPYLVWMLVLVGIPLLMIFILSFMNTDGVSFAGATWTTAAWEKMFTLADTTNLQILGYTFLTAFVATVICFLIGYPMAYIVARSPFSNKFVILILTIIPMWSNSLLRNVALKNILSESNILDSLLSRIGLSFSIVFANQDQATFISIVIGLVLTFLPFMILPIYTVIEKIDESLLEASMDLGANRVRTFAKVTFPLSMKGVTTGIIMVFLPCFSGFAIQKLLSSGTVYVLGSLIEVNYIHDINFVSMLSIVILVLIFGSMMIVNKVDKEGATLV
ncbi:MAG TPA: ABC transporter permease [Acholeplasmatales bacterium]|nr:ABC transporter permease [Acholeplasmatales bacterium]